jgi:hypothetical protein
LERKRKESESERKESAAIDLQQAGIHACAASTAGKKVALIFYRETADNQREQATGEKAKTF